ncbi:helix-turn-helix domain-containing protein [Poseidonibacter antarcticus]|uniref:helix-turn-helix domain-containing protein n=1 Tax=Poseidonibacter antarcticus TaxID=2478538 RepID=UPI000EF4DAF4
MLKESITFFKQRGYHNTSISNIAESCGLLKGSIYHHFKSKTICEVKHSVTSYF